MKILAFDTALGSGSVAIMDGDTTLAYVTEPSFRSLAERLVPMIEEALTQADLTYQDMDRVVVTNGPGTFVGLRIGVATARSIAVAAGIPAVGVTSLAALAQNLADEAMQGDTIAVCIDARRGEVFLQVFELDEGGLSPLADPVAIAVEQATGCLPAGGGTLVGTGCSLIEPPDSWAVAPVSAWSVDARKLARLASGRIDSDNLPSPLYLRAPDAKIANQAATER